MENAVEGASGSNLDQLTRLFRLLSDKTRLSIILLLSQGERNVTTLCQELDLPQPTVSHHLGLLRMNDLIGNRRVGKQVFYSVNGRLGSDSNTGIQVTLDEYAVSILRRSSSAVPAADGR